MNIANPVLPLYLCVGYGCFTTGTPVYRMLPFVDDVSIIEDEEAKLDLSDVTGLHSSVLQTPIHTTPKSGYSLIHNSNILLYPIFAKLSELVWR